MLEIDLSRDDGDTRVISFLSGEFDISEKERVDRLLTTVVSTGLRALVVDLSGISFLDSSAVGLLISHAANLQEFDARLCIVLATMITSSRNSATLESSKKSPAQIAGLYR